MISRVAGELVSVRGDEVEVRARDGLVYLLHVPESVARRLPRAGAAVELLTLYVVRDDAPWLYGFLEVPERALFQRLISVPRVGPALAKSLMGAHEVGRLARAVSQGDVRFLASARGMGRKTAERVVLELAGKLDDLVAGAGAGGGSSARAREAVAALIRLGYSAPDADRAVAAAVAADGEADAEDLVRRALAPRSP